MIIAPLLREPTGDLDDPDVNGIVIDPSATTFEGERRCGRQVGLRAPGRVNASPEGICGAAAFGDPVGRAAYSIIRETDSAILGLLRIRFPMTHRATSIDQASMDARAILGTTKVRDRKLDLCAVKDQWERPLTLYRGKARHEKKKRPEGRRAKGNPDSCLPAYFRERRPAASAFPGPDPGLFH
jgi:hypothetical protein